MSNQPSRGPLVYPPSRRDDTVDDHHGTRIADPYRWLEDPDSEETRAWIEAQNRLTFGFLDGAPERDEIRRRITRRWNHERHGLPVRRGRRAFWSHNDGLQNHAVVYWADEAGTSDREPRVLLDPNAWSADGTVALAGLSLSEDGELAAYGVQEAGSDWVEWRVRRVATGEDLPDRLRWVKFSTPAWTHDGAGFYYARYPAPGPGEVHTDANLDQALHYHRLGEAQAEDRLVYRRPDEPRWIFDVQVTEDGDTLVISVSKGTGRVNLVLYQTLGEGGADRAAPIETLVGTFEAELDLVGSDGPLLWFRTNLDAPRGRIIAVDLRRPAREHWVELVPQGEHVIEAASAVGGRLFVSYLEHAHTRVAVFDPQGGAPLGDVALPGLGTAGGFGGRREHRDTFYSFTSFSTPATILRHDIERGESEVFRAPTVADFDPTRYRTEQVFVTSPDGTRVPMFVTSRTDRAGEGPRPTILYGYGGFNVSLTPFFSVVFSVWMDMGGVLAIANLRGGGEYGEEWHRAGTLDRKQNVFDDFIACAEWLIARGVTSPARLAIQGGSNGGLLVGACMTQRPELFGAALPSVGVMDMLRFHRFTIGWAWVDDYGSAEDPEQFRTLLAYSPLHNLRPGTRYPATLVTTGDHDDRVVPAHSFKFAAALQAAQGGEAPVLIRIQTQAGHGAGKPTSMMIEEAADGLAFLARVFDLREPW